MTQVQVIDRETEGRIGKALVAVAVVTTLLTVALTVLTVVSP
ncbi:MAG: hypothetical protein SV253_09970 [Halobacteria archaeon]|nr:hypothetical protein [Halobacteria archaeon]